MVTEAWDVTAGWHSQWYMASMNRRKYRVLKLIQSGDDDYLMNETRRKQTFITIYIKIISRPRAYFPCLQ